LQGHRVKTKRGSGLYIHRVTLLPLNLRTVSEQSEETSKCAYSFFYVDCSGWLTGICNR